MTGTTASGDPRRINAWRVAGWGFAGLLLLLPAVAMQFTREVNWDWRDFLIIGVMLGIVGGVIEIGARMSRNRAYRAAVGVAAVAGFLLIWVNLAVGILGGEGNPANLMFVGVLAVAVIGALVARLQASRLVLALIATTVAQASVGAIALAAGWASPGRTGLYEVIVGTTLFGTLWLLSAALFAKAARDQATAR